MATVGTVVAVTLFLTTILTVSSFQSPRLPTQDQREGTISNQHLSIEEKPTLRVSPPCPAYEDIFPCTCMNYSNGRTFLDCDGVLDEAVVYRALHVPGYGMNPLDTLYASHGTIKTISRGLFSERTFQNLVFDENEIDTVEAGALEPLMLDLKSLYLNSNRLTYPIVELLLDFRQLVTLSQTDNLVSDVTSLTQLTRTIDTLVSFSLAGNLLTALPAHTFRAFPSLEALRLSDNRIRYVDPEAFADLPKMTHLHLDGNLLNQLGSPEVGSIVTPRQLLNLILSRSDITDMTPGWVDSPQGTPLGIELEDEPMRQFPEEVYGRELRTCAAAGGYFHISVADTYFDCGCDLFWVVNDRTLMDHLIGGRCGNESDGRPWHYITDLDPDEMRPECLITTTVEPAGP